MFNRQFYRARWVQALAAFVLLLLFLPVIVRPILVEVLLDNGFSEVEIDNIGVNWFTGQVTVEQVALGSDGQAKLSVGLIRLELSWLALLRGELLAEEAEITDVQFAVIQRPDNSWDIVVPLTPGQQQNPETAEPVALPKLELSSLELKRADIHIQTEYAAGYLAVKSLSLEHIVTVYTALLQEVSVVVVGRQVRLDVIERRIDV